MMPRPLVAARAINKATSLASVPEQVKTTLESEESWCPEQLALGGGLGDFQGLTN
jgi:hypothetical protein